MAKPKNALIWIVGVIAAVILLLPLCTYQVRTTETAIVSTFGKYGSEPVDPGLHVKWPWPAQKVHKLDASLQVFEGRLETAYTADDKALVVSFYAAWRVSDPSRFLESVGARTDGADASAILAGLISSEKTIAIGQASAADLIAVRELGADDSFAAIEQTIMQRVAAKALANNGITIEALGIQYLGVPESVTDEIFQRMRAQRAVRTQEIRADGEAQAAAIRLDADKDAQQKLAEARAQASKIRNEGDVAAAQAYDAFARDPEFALFLRRLQALESTVDDETTLVISTDVRPYDMLDPKNAFAPLADGPAPAGADEEEAAAPAAPADAQD